jgi:hypothetical protein
MTAMQDAFERAGFPKREAEFLRVLAQYTNNGGTFDRAHELVDYAAAQNAGKGHVMAARQGQRIPAHSRQQNGDAAGQGNPAHEGHQSGARPSPAGQGQRTVADKARGAVPAPRPMSEGRRKALARVSEQRVRTFWDTEVGGVKRRLGSLTRFDIVQIKRRSMIDNHIADRLLTEIKWPDSDTTPLERIGQEKHVKAIVESAADALEAFNA